LYYAQRADAGLIVSEGVCVSPEAIGDRRLPGLWARDQIDAWKPVTDAVHARGGTIVAQLWHTGRGSHPLVQPNGQAPVAPSAIPIENDFSLDGELIPSVVPRALELEEIPRVIGDYARAARNALLAGFDGVELHGANGYLIDEFLQDGSNRRDDEYGGSVSNRVRFLDKLLEAVGSAVGPGSVGLRISPSSTFQSMRDSNPSELWSHVLALVETHELAYLHVVEPGIHGSSKHRSNADDIDSAWIRARYSGALIAAGRYEADSAEATVASGQLDAVAFGRLYTSNPDLPERLRERAELLTPHRPTFYTADDEGYIDWPTLRAEALLRDLKEGHIDAAPLRKSITTPTLSGTTPFEEWEAVWALTRHDADTSLEQQDVTSGPAR
jgi:N-ethylmaleimide reductase